MATEVTIYVDPDATGLNDGSSWVNAYTDLGIAYSTEAKDIVSSDEIYIFLCRNSAGSAMNSATFGGFTTDATRYVVIRAADGYEALKTGWDDSRFRIDEDDSENYVYEDHIRLEGLQVRSDYTSTTNRNILEINAIVADNDIRFSRCRVESNGLGTYAGIYDYDIDANIKIFDCIIFNCHRYGVATLGNTEIYNTVIAGTDYGGSSGAIAGTSGTLVAKNCALLLNSDDINFSGSSSDIDYVASDDGDGTNPVSPSGGDWNNEFVDPANGDFTLLNTGNLYQGGIDDPGSGLYSTDIEGDSFNTPWDIGADSYTPTGTTYNESVSDSILIADSVTGNISYVESVSDGLVFSEAVSETDVALAVKMSVTISEKVPIINVSESAPSIGVTGE